MQSLGLSNFVFSDDNLITGKAPAFKFDRFREQLRSTLTISNCQHCYFDIACNINNKVSTFVCTPRATFTILYTHTRAFPIFYPGVPTFSTTLGTYSYPNSKKIAKKTTGKGLRKKNSSSGLWYFCTPQQGLFITTFFTWTRVRGTGLNQFSVSVSSPALSLLLFPLLPHSPHLGYHYTHTDPKTIIQKYQSPEPKFFFRSLFPVGFFAISYYLGRNMCLM